MSHIPYEENRKRLPDFIVEYDWEPDEELKTVKRYQGIRSDFLYEGDDPKSDGIHMIWPEFLDENGAVVLEKEVEVSPHGFANMWVLMEERRSYHRDRIKIGTKGYLVCGSKKLATATVIQIGGLYDAKS